MIIAACYRTTQKHAGSFLKKDEATVRERGQTAIYKRSCENRIESWKVKGAVCEELFFSLKESLRL